MKVAELIAELQRCDPECPVIFPLHSDYTEVSGVAVVQAVEKNFYFMRTHPTMSEQDKKDCVNCVVLDY